MSKPRSIKIERKRNAHHFMGSERSTMRDWLLLVEDGCWSDIGKQKQLSPQDPSEQMKSMKRKTSIALQVFPCPTSVLRFQTQCGA